jgi:hypothetical protein
VNLSEINSNAQAYFGENAATNVIKTQISAISTSLWTESSYAGV